MMDTDRPSTKSVWYARSLELFSRIMLTNSWKSYRLNVAVQQCTVLYYLIGEFPQHLARPVGQIKWPCGLMETRVYAD